MSEKARGDKLNTPIRILHVIGAMNRGGAETMIMNLYRHIDRSKVQFDFVEHAKEAVFDNEIRQLGGRIYRCPRFVGVNYMTYRRWWKSFFHRNSRIYPVIHGHIGSSAGVYLDEAKKAGIYTIAHSHNTNGRISVKNLMYRAFSHRTRYIADYFFGCSEAAGKDRFGRKIVSGNRFSLLNNAIDVPKYSFNEQVRCEVRRDLGIQPQELLVGHVGRFEEQKNHRFLIKCFNLLARKKENTKLLLIGDGSLVNEIEDQIDSVGLTNQVILAGVRSDVYRLLQAMDVFVFPSLYEGLPVTMVEAQAAGLPCVISDVITDETVLIEELVRKESPKKGLDAWCRDIMQMAEIQRRDRSTEIINKGYDVHTTARWLEEFYLDKARQ